MIRSALSSRDGSVAVTTALALTAVIGAGAFALDLGYQSLNGTALQNAADAAALAAVRELPNPVRARSTAVEYAQLNVTDAFGTVTTESDVVVGNYDFDSNTFTADHAPNNAVRVKALRSRARGNSIPRFFAGVLGQGSGEMQRTAIAAVTRGVGACVFALDPSASESFFNSGSGEVRVPSCGIAVNSNAAVALFNRGPGGTHARSISIVGGYDGVNITETPLTWQHPIDDPLLDLGEPDIPEKCDSNNTNIDRQSRAPQPGQVYCKRANFTGNIHLAPGVYYFRDAQVTVGSNATLTGDGVTLIFDRDSTFDSAGSGTNVRLTAPTAVDAPTRGLAIWASRLLPTPGKKEGEQMNTFRFRGAKNYFIKGSIYLPMQRAEFVGNSELDVSFMEDADMGYVIAQQLSFSGRARFTFDLHGHVNAIEPRGIGTRVALVK